jgi:RNase H-fold protein (predicted Holliday junction resolvase)
MGRVILSGEPPEGVVAGEDVPKENDEYQEREAKIDEMANALKTREEYREYSQEERREIARQKLEKVS